MENSLGLLEQASPFPMAEDLLLHAKSSIPEQVPVSAVDNALTESPTKQLEPLESLDSEQSFAPFMKDLLHDELLVNGKLEAAIGDFRDRENISVKSKDTEEEEEEEAAENGVEEAGNDALRTIAISPYQKEDAIHENGGETDALIGGEESHLTLPKDVILGNGKEGRETGLLREEEEFGSSLQMEDAIFQNGTQGIDSPPLKEGKESRPFSQKEDQILNDSGEERGTDALKEEVVSSEIAVGKEDGFGENRKEEEEIEPIQEGDVGSAVNLTGGIENLRGREGVTKSDLDDSDANYKVNGTGKLETLGELFARERQEIESREGVKGAGEEISGQASVDQNAHKVSEVMGSTMERQQHSGESDTTFHRISRPPIPTLDGQESVKQRSSTIGSSIVGDILYNLAVGNEDGHSRQRILAFVAKRYAANVERNPEDHDALYNWALVLQESADNTGPEMDSVSKDALLDEACKKYEAATQLCPSLHEAFYNWAIAISDRAKIRGRTKEAEELWKQACDKYEQAVQLNWNSPQALNNWGLALQELGAIVPLKQKLAIVKKGIRKFRAAIQLRFDFHRAVYNLGTVLYGLAEDTSRIGQKQNLKELAPADLYSLSAVYIAAAHALKPDYPVYRGALRLVRSMLPLPYIKSGWLKIALPGNPLAPHSDWMRLWFVLDHEALYEMEKVDRKSLAHSYSRRVTFTETSSSSLPARASLLRIGMEEIVHLAPSADLSLPPGGGFCIETSSGSQNLIAETWDAMDSWVDAVRLVYTIYAQGKKDVLAGVLAG